MPKTALRLNSQIDFINVHQSHRTLTLLLATLLISVKHTTHLGDADTSQFLFHLEMILKDPGSLEVKLQDNTRCHIAIHSRATLC